MITDPNAAVVLEDEYEVEPTNHELDMIDDVEIEMVNEVEDWMYD